MLHWSQCISTSTPLLFDEKLALSMGLSNCNTLLLEILSCQVAHIAWLVLSHTPHSYHSYCSIYVVGFLQYSHDVDIVVSQGWMPLSCYLCSNLSVLLHFLSQFRSLLFPFPICLFTYSHYFYLTIINLSHLLDMLLLLLKHIHVQDLTITFYSSLCCCFYHILRHCNISPNL